MIEVTPNLIKSIFPKRQITSNKGDFGKVLNIVGSEEYIGAGILSSIASLKVGAGYSILCSEKNTINFYKNFSPDLIYKSHNNFNHKEIIKLIKNENISAIVLGCGIGKTNKTINFTEKILSFLLDKSIPTIIDADGLNCLSELNIKNLNENFILTPHPKELSKLLKTETKAIQEDREKSILIANKQYHANIILKGHQTLITDGIDIYKNLTGNSALAKSGTGDVLAGMLGGFLAYGISPLNASILATHLHGLAGDIYANEFSEYSMLASDLHNYIPKAIKEVLCHN